MTRIAVTQNLAPCLQIRREVFIDEQGVSEEEEIDGLDGIAIHLLATDDFRPVGTARLLVEGDIGKIGRVAVIESARGRGIGAQLIEAALEEFRRIPDLTKARLGAQTHAIPFYERLGFTAHGDEYDDAGIPHRDMTRAL